MNVTETGGLPPQSSQATRPAPGAGDLPAPKKSIKRRLLVVLGVYIAGLVALVVVYGAKGTRNTSFEPQNEFKLDNWVAPRHLLDQQGRALPVLAGDR